MTNQKMQWAIAGVVGSVYVRRRRQRTNYLLSHPAEARPELSQLVDR